MAITVGVNNIPVAEATLEVVAERSDAALAAATAATTRNVVAVIPHGPASARDVEVLNTVEDLGHHITEVSVLPDADSVVDGLITLMTHVDSIFTTAEAFEGIEAAFVEDELADRIELLFSRIQVGEVDRSALRAVGAVEQHIDSHTIEPHILVEAVRPNDLALARQLQFVAARSRRSRRRRTTSTFNDGDVVQAHDVLVVAVEVTEGNILLTVKGAQVNRVVEPSAESEAFAVT